MRKDIEIPEVKDVYIAAVYEFNDDYNVHDWNIYMINDGSTPIETVLIVAQGYNEKKMTSPMRKTIKIVPAKGFAKIEFIDESVFVLDNFFTITFFREDKMYDKRYEIPRNSIMQDNTVDLPVMPNKGVLAR
ncbi:hypothetical protein ULMS_05270 [Patiriisocius marinistellae]|uniref:Phenylalanyl-tRNA synthetase subunit alpha n=1 Tax=Patiriisocius marinistellae TaxID=2494560 RepID=A0A5J4FY10_9FLAO|nr:hypothetical protein [Patiriisocius marinistellae]GEQ85019.1 hypothetical protein ULMS_05270 [Patiriisocius marinistellae]